MKIAHTPVLDIAYEESGPANGRPVVLMHGFPDDAHAYDGVAPPLAAAGCRVIVPYLRGYGPTRFRNSATPRSGQQAALGHDLLDLIDTLDLRNPILAGYDWVGGRRALSLRFGPSGSAVSSRSTGITSKTSPIRGVHRHQPPNIVTGINGISISSAAVPGLRRTADRCVGSCGNCGRPTIASAMPITR
jgi:hypothetical protein